VELQPLRSLSFRAGLIVIDMLLLHSSLLLPVTSDSVATSDSVTSYVWIVFCKLEWSRIISVKKASTCGGRRLNCCSILFPGGLVGHFLIVSEQGGNQVLTAAGGGGTVIFMNLSLHS
jgi:hypothetical protein